MLARQAAVEAMSVSELIQTLNATADAPPSNVTEEERAALLAACDKLKGILENPLEAIVRIVFAVSYSPTFPRLQMVI